MKKILLCFILMLSCLTITACKGEEEALNDEIDTSSSEYILYSNAKSNGYSDSFELWESELESNIILLRMVDTNIEWMFNTSTSWNKLYDDDGTSPSWYRQFVAGNVYEYYQYYTVTFNTNCSSKIESQIVEKGSTISEPSTPTNDGFRFTGWFYEGSGQQFIFNQTQITSPITLEIVWIVNDIDFKDFTQIDDYFYLEVDNDVSTINMINYVTSTTDWYLVSEFSNDTIITKRASLNVGLNTYFVVTNLDSSNNHVYELKIKRLDMFLVTYQYNATNSSSIKTESTYIQENDYANELELDKDGYSYVTSSNYNNKVTENTTITITYSPNKYNVSFDVNGGNEIDSNKVEVTFDSYLNFETPKRDGYKFLGWEYNGQLFNNSTIYNIANNIAFTAKWEEYDYKIVYELDGGINNELNPSGYDEGNKSITLNKPTKAGYTFEGWYDFDFRNQITFIPSNSTQDYTLYALWEANEYQITFNVNGGNSLESNVLDVVYGSSFVLPVVTKLGYTFLGWYNGSNKVESGTWSTLESINVVAKWTIETYTITYELNGGTNSVNNPSSYDIETEFTLEIPTRTGYTFEGWKVNNEFYESYTILNSTGNLVIEVLWEAVSYNITYELNGGTNNDNNPSSYSLDDGTITLINPSKEGYVSGYWCLDEELTNQITYLNQSLLEQVDSTNIVLYASYSQNYPDLYIFQDENHNGDTYSYLYFGKYPQTVELDSSITSELDKLTSTNEDGYYEYNGVEYKKHTTNLYSTSYTWINGTTALNNKSYYFKVEPIKWRVIQNDGTIQVLSEYIIDQSQFYSSSSSRTINGETIYANNYEYSDLREFLNNTFLNTAFTTSQQELIKTSLVDNSASTTNSSFNSYTCNNTNDKIYALSYQDVNSTEYGFSPSTSSSDTREAIVTDYAMANYVYKSSRCGYWWLRSPYSYDSLYACSVSSSGYVNFGSVDYSYYGVRPAFIFN